MKLVLVEWDDALENAAWRHIDDETDIKVVPIVTVGVLLKETDKYLSLIQTRGTDIYTGSMTIPRGCIKRIRYLGVRNNWN